MVAYSGTQDLLTGNIPTPTYLSPEKFVNDAADEIDSKIGFIYQTPIPVDDLSATARPVRLLLKRLNNFLATGRLLMAVDAGAETDRVHAYGASLIKDALASLDMIAQGKLTLDGVERVPSDQAEITAPLQYNKDEESNVEAFYDRIANPEYSYYPGLLPPNEGGLVR